MLNTTTIITKGRRWTAEPRAEEPLIVSVSQLPKIGGGEAHLSELVEQRYVIHWDLE